MESGKKVLAQVDGGGARRWRTKSKPHTDGRGDNEPAAAEVRRMARRGGVKRLTQSTHPAVRLALTEYLERVIGSAVILTEYRGAKTVTTEDVVHALAHQGMHLYGAGVRASGTRRAAKRRAVQRSATPEPEEGAPSQDSAYEAESDAAE